VKKNTTERESTVKRRKNREKDINKLYKEGKGCRGGVNQKRKGEGPFSNNGGGCGGETKKQGHPSKSN